MQRNHKTSCDICSRGTSTKHAHCTPAERLDEPHRYTICTRTHCDSLGNHLTWWLQNNADVNCHTFEELLDVLDGHEDAKQKFTPKWERPSRSTPPGRASFINDFTGGVENAE